MRFAPYTSGRLKELKVGISNYSENKNSLDIIGNLTSTKIGIGTTNPTSQLHVVGDTLITGISTFKDNSIIEGSLTVGSAAAITGGAPTDEGNLAVYGSGRNSLIIQTNNNSLDRGIAFRNNGDFYVSHISAVDAGSNTADLVFGVESGKSSPDTISERMRITKEGNVGIGTQVPTDQVGASNTSILAVGILTAYKLYSTVFGEFTGGSVLANTIVGAALSISGISTIGDANARTINVSGVSTFTGNIDANGNLDVDGHTELDNVNVAGIATFSGRIVGAATSNVIPFLYSNYSDLPSASTYHGAFAHVHSLGKALYAHAGNWFELVNKEADGRVGTGTETYNIGNINAGISTFSGDINANGNIVGDNSTNISGINSVTATTFFGGLTGNVTGNADTATTATVATNILVSDESSDAENFVVFTNTASGNQTPRTGSNLTFNASNGQLNATTFVGNLTGTVNTSAQPNITSLGTLSSLNVSGDVSIGGTLTYEDVTNIDSIGLITARSGIKDQTLTAGRVVYVDSDKTLTDSANLIFDGNNLGIGTDIPTNEVGASNTSILAVGILTASRIYSTVFGEFTGGTVTGDAIVGTALSISGISTIGDANARTINVSGVSTFTGNIDANGDLDVDGHTELDQLNVSGISTFVGITSFKDDVTFVTSDGKNIFFDKSTDRMRFGTGVRLVMGDGTGGDDLNIFHNSINTIIGQNTVPLIFDTDNTIFGSQSGDRQIEIKDGGSVDLYHNNNLRLSTVGYGLSITGITSTTHLNVTGDAIVGGAITATSFSGDGSNLTNLPSSGIGTNGNVNTTGIITAAQFHGDGSNLTGIPGFSPDSQENLYAGTNAGAASDGDTCFNVAIGYDAGRNLNSGDNNVLLGKNAGCALQNGGNNIVLGANAGCSLVNGGNNFVAGQNAAISLVNGSNNFIAGNNAGCSLVNGGNNFVVGANAGRALSNGGNNVTIGSNAGTNLSGGGNNFLVGSNSGKCLTGSGHNVYFGASSGKCTTGNCNIAIGKNVYCEASTGSNNIILGEQAGTCLTSGSHNFLVGRRAGYLLTSGSCSIMIGCCVNALSPTDNKQLAIGMGSKYWVTGNSDFNVGIGTTNPSSRLSVVGGVSVSGILTATNIKAESNLTVDGGNLTLLNGDLYVNDQIIHYNDTDTSIQFDDDTIIFETGGSERLRIASLGQIGLSGTNYGTSGQVLTSNGSSSAPSWQAASGGGFDPDAQENLYAGTNAGSSSDADTCFNVAIGYSAGVNNSAGDHNVFLGTNSGNDTTIGSFNFFGGYKAAKGNIGGACNVYIGNQVGYAATGGEQNIALGQKAAYNNSTGSYNIFFGSCAGYCSSSGTGNIALGLRAGAKITSGACNVFLGFDAGCCATGSLRNVYIGTNAGKTVCGGAHDIGLGSDNLCESKRACNNIAIGKNVFVKMNCDGNTNGLFNIGIGAQVGSGVTVGGYNLLLGYQAGFNFVCGSDNIILGRQAGRCASNGTKNIFIGCQAGRSTVTAACAGNSNIAIGNYAGTMVSGLSDRNVFIGNRAGAEATGGCFNIALGADAGTYVTGHDNVFIGQYAGSNQAVSGNSNVVIGKQVCLPSASGSTQLAIGAGATSWISGDSSFNVGIGTTNPTSKLHLVDGDLTIESVTPQLIFNDTTGSPDYKIRKQSGHFMIMETGQTNDSEWRLSIRSGGTIDIPGNLDTHGDLDVDGQTELDDLNVSGVSTFNANVRLLDNDKLQIGTGQDLELYHDTTDSRIENSQGDIKFKNVGSYYFFDEDGGETLASLINDGAVNLYFAGSKKLETTSTGAIVSGILTATSFSGDGSGLTNLPAGPTPDKIEEGDSKVEVTDSGTGQIDIVADSRYAVRFKNQNGNRSYAIFGSNVATQNNYGSNDGNIIISEGGQRLRFFKIGVGLADDTVIGTIDFAAQQSGTGGQSVSLIQSSLRGGVENKSDLIFSTSNGGSPTEKLRIMHTGNVGIGTTNPDAAVGVGNTAKLSVGIVSAYQLYGDGVTATTLTGTLQTAAQTNITSLGTLSSLSVTGNVSIGGTLTYEDVTNVDSIGIVTAREGIFIPDNKKIELGNASGNGDLQIYHDSSHSVIKDNGTGMLKILGSTIAIKTGNDNETMATFIPNGAVSLFYDNSKKIETTSSGAIVTGILTASTLTGTLQTAAQPNVTSLGTITNLVASSAKVSDLTSGRVVVVGTSGELEDSSAFTFSGGTVTATAFAGDGSNLTNLPGISTSSDPSFSQVEWDVVNNGASSYRFTGPGNDGAEDNPDLYLVRGQKYTFNVNASGHPFKIRVSNGGSDYSDGVINNGAQSGKVIINVQHDAPAQLVYQCQYHGGMVGNIYIVGQHLANGADNRVITATSAYGFNGESNLTFNGSTLTVTGTVAATSYTGDGSSLTGITTTGDIIDVTGITTTSGTFNVSAGVSTNIDSFAYASADYKTAEYTLHFMNGSNIQAQKLLVMRNGTTAFSEEYGVMSSSDLLVSVGATVSSGNVLIQATPETGVSGVTTYRWRREVQL